MLAGGVVLADGGATTLASWQDQTYDRAPLSLSGFDVQQNTGSGWADADTDALAGALSLTVQGTAGLLAPGGAITGPRCSSRPRPSPRPRRPAATARWWRCTPRSTCP